jgi:hypothetical protein
MLSNVGAEAPTPKSKQGLRIWLALQVRREAEQTAEAKAASFYAGTLAEFPTFPFADGCLLEPKTC